MKEKLGGLRMYWDRRWVEIDTNPYDFEIPNLARGDRPRRMERRLAEVATLSFDEDVSEEDINLAAAAAARELMLPETVTDQIRSIVENAVMQASTICQLCGQPGSHANIGGWLAVACEKHRNYDEFVAERARSAD
ncbi:MAG: hypothetical protein IPO38_07640 [Rhodocyclaceae bacterium]|nr:hypothetical protein [Rhodocyclaceae bacterium]